MGLGCEFGISVLNRTSQIEEFEHGTKKIWVNIFWNADVNRVSDANGERFSMCFATG